jgi:anti-anti-sigma regulatory factor
VAPSRPASTDPTASLTEAIDPIAGTVRVSGHLTAQGADLLRGTVENLCRLGHSHVVLDMAGVHATDDAALPVLNSLRRDDSGARVVLLHAG